MKKQELVYSEPVRDIMGSPPSGILRRGTAVIFSVFALLFIFSWLLRYPDLIPSPVEITTENPPVTLVSKLTGKIKHLYVNDGEMVETGKILAVMETAADINDINTLRHFVDTIDNFTSPSIDHVPDLTGLGELQNYFSIYRQSSVGLLSFIRNDYYGNKIKSAKEELEALKRYSIQLRESERLITENLLLEMNRFRRDSVLRSGKTIPDAEYERSRQELNRQRIALQSVRLEISGKKMEEINIQQLIIEYAIKKKEELDRISSSVEESFRNLMAQMKIWENNYLLISPVSGTVTFTRFWSENQTANRDEPVLTIVPACEGKYIGRVFLGMQRSGKVDTGQNVYIKLSSYPHLEYGMVPGIVKTKSLVPSGEAYVIEIELPAGLTTLYGKQLVFTQNMKGTAEIITNDRTLLNRIVSPFRYLVSRNKRD